MTRTVYSIFAVLTLSLVVSGCANTVVLRAPHNADEIELVSEPGPRFSWGTKKLQHPAYRYEYEITVAKDSSFSEASVVYNEDRLQGLSHEISREDGWLPGGQHYYWRVTGVGRNTDGEIKKELKCPKIREFDLETREKVAVDLKVPTGTQISEVEFKIADTAYTADTEFEMENGESREITVLFKLGEETIDLHGQILIVGVNENTRVGKIVMDGFTEESLINISTGNVGKYSYQLGGDVILRVNLGNR